MSNLEKLNARPTDKELKDVGLAASALASYACSLSAQYIQSGMLRLEFNNEVACYMAQIVNEFETGAKSFTQALQAILEEQRSLIDQALEYSTFVIGLVAGGYQIVGGILMCAGSGFKLCAVGAVSVAHGANNVYENGRNILTGRSDTEGPVRQLYQHVAMLTDAGKKSHGDIAYGTVDLALSAYGLFRTLPAKDTWRLFHYLGEDKVQAYKETKHIPLGTDIFSDMLTAKGIIKNRTMIRTSMKDEHRANIFSLLRRQHHAYLHFRKDSELMVARRIHQLSLQKSSWIYHAEWIFSLQPRSHGRNIIQRCNR